MCLSIFLWLDRVKRDMLKSKMVITPVQKAVCVFVGSHTYISFLRQAFPLFVPLKILSLVLCNCISVSVYVCDFNIAFRLVTLFVWFLNGEKEKRSNWEEVGDDGIMVVACWRSHTISWLLTSSLAHSLSCDFDFTQSNNHHSHHHHNHPVQRNFLKLRVYKYCTYIQVSKFTPF